MGRSKRKPFKPPCTKWEKMFALILNDMGVKYRAGQPYRCGRRTFYPDFFIPNGKIVIEIDGHKHGLPERKAKDRKRTKLLRKHGVQHVLRLWNSDIEAGVSNPRVIRVIREIESVRFDQIVEFCFVQVD